MQFQLNFKSGKPVYLQVVDQVKAAAASGAVRAGEPLPSIRPLAELLRVNRNTVAKAYAELESQGVIETVAGKGCFVRTNNSPFKKEVRIGLLAQEIDDAVIQAHNVPLMAIPTMGESWHCNHHAFPGSARHGLYPGQIDLGWHFIQLLQWLGLAWNVQVPANLPPRPGISPVTARALSAAAPGQAALSRGRT